MREPVEARPSEIDSLPDRAAVFLLWASRGLRRILARTALLRRRLRRLISNRDRVSRVLNLHGVVERIEYWPVGSQLEVVADSSGARPAIFPRGLAAHHAPACSGVRAPDAR